MSFVIERYAPLITPYGLRDYYLMKYFLAPDISVMVWGRPGVGKSAATWSAGVEIASAVDSFVKYAFALAYKLEKSGQDRFLEVAFQKLALLLTKALPFRTRSGYDFLGVYELEGRNVAYRLSELVSRASVDEILKAKVNTSPHGRARAEELGTLLYNLYRLEKAVSGGRLVAEIAEKGLDFPLVLFNDDVNLIDYKCYAVVPQEYLSKHDVQCVEKRRIGESDICIRGVGRTGCLLVNLAFDDDFKRHLAKSLIAMRFAADYIDAYEKIANFFSQNSHRIIVGLFFHFEDFRLSQLELDDIKGLPSDAIARVLALEKGVESAKMAKVLWLTPPWLITNGLGLLFLDEVNQAQPWAQAAAYNIILDRRLTTGKKLSPNVDVVAAGNQPEFAPGVARNLPPPLRNRFANFVMENTVSPDLAINQVEKLAYVLHEKLYKESSGAEFVRWLETLGYRFEVSEREWYIKMTDEIGSAGLSATIESASLRNLVVVTNRSLEFFKRLVSFTPSEFQALIEKSFSIQEAEKLHFKLLFYLAYSYLSTLGIRSSEEAKGLSEDVEILKRYGIITAVLWPLISLFRNEVKTRDRLIAEVREVFSIAYVMLESGLITQEDFKSEALANTIIPEPPTEAMYVNLGRLLKIEGCEEKTEDVRRCMCESITKLKSEENIVVRIRDVLKKDLGVEADSMSEDIIRAFSYLLAEYSFGRKYALERQRQKLESLCVGKKEETKDGLKKDKARSV